MFVPVVKSVMLVRDAEDSGEVMARALAEAAAPPSRPVYVEIPTDYLSASVADERRAVTVGGAEPGGPLDEDAIQRAVALLDSAERPLVWAGGGAVASGAGPAIGQLAERLVAPIVTTYQARGLVGRDHPCAVGVPPHVQAVGSLWDEADVVVGIGTDFDGMMTQNWRMPPPKHLITVNVDNVDASKNYQPDVMIGADASVGVNALTGKLAARQGLPELEKQLATLRLDVREELRAEYPEAVEFLDEFEGAVPRDSVVVCDMCIPGYWLSAFHPVSAPRQLAYPMGWGTLGFAFPAAMGTALGADVPVVSVSGDGGFLFACGELATVAKEQIPLTIVIVDDGGYGMLRFDQRNSGEQPFGVDLNPPDFVALANSFGVDAEAVDGLSKEFGRALADHMKARTPSVLVATASLEPPPTTSPRWYRPR
jgi:acetolactate synthase-1/2/3 large subunit